MEQHTPRPEPQHNPEADLQESESYAEETFRLSEKEGTQGKPTRLISNPNNRKPVVLEDIPDTDMEEPMDDEIENLLNLGGKK